MVGSADLGLPIVLFLHFFKVIMAIRSRGSPSPRPLPSKRTPELSFAPAKRKKESSIGSFGDEGFEFGFGEGIVPWKGELEEKAVSRMTRKRPARIVVPESWKDEGFEEVERVLVERESSFEGEGYWLANKRGNKQVMEDGYDVVTNINGNPKQAYFGVFDGHGGNAAVDFVSKNLGNNIMAALNDIQTPESAIRSGYLSTDQDFLTKNLGSGACVATILIKDGHIHAANAGDCKVVMSKNGVAHTLTTDHRPETEPERNRIENTGGFVSCRNGVWRVQGSLSISRAIGDLHMKEWIISEPEIKTTTLSPDCEFLILATDGVWDKVTGQEAVDMVTRGNNTMKSCKTLVDLATSRNSRDDITVMVVNLKRFVEEDG